MSKNNVQKRAPGRPTGSSKPIKYFTDEDRKNAIKESKTKYMHMVNKEWYCEDCNNGKNYTLAGKKQVTADLENMMNVRMY